MPTIHTHPAQPPQKPTEGPSPAQAAAQAKTQEACPPAQGKAAEVSKPAGDSNQVKQGAQGKAQPNLSLDDLGKQLEASKAQVDALDKAKQKADSTFRAQLEPLEAEIAKNKARLKELDHEIDSLWSLNPESHDPTPPEPAKPDPELELINKIKDPDVKLKMLKQRAERLSKELEKDFEGLDLPEIKVIDSRDWK